MKYQAVMCDSQPTIFYSDLHIPLKDLQIHFRKLHYGLRTMTDPIYKSPSNM